MWWIRTGKTLSNMKQKKMPTKVVSIPVEIIERRIYLVRGQKVMLDSDLADLYQVLTKNLNKTVRRNLDRFPKDFMFQLNKEEVTNLRFQFGTSSSRSQFETLNNTYGGRRYLPHVFTEHGVAMLSSVLNSKRAVQMNILIIRAFVHLREIMASHKDMARAIEKLKRQQKDHGKHIQQLYAIFEKMIEAPKASKHSIGFSAD